MKKMLSIFTLLLYFSFPSFAESVVGAQASYGGQNVKLKWGETGGDDFVLDAYYRYMFHPNIGIDVGWLSAGGGIGSFIVDQVSEIKEVTYRGFNAGLVYRHPLTDALGLYSRVGINNYQVDYLFNNVSQTEKEIGYEISVGGEARFSNGLGFNLGYRFIDNSIIESNQVVLGTSFQF